MLCEAQVKNMASSRALAGILLTIIPRLIVTVKILFYLALLKASARALHVRLNRNRVATSDDDELGLWHRVASETVSVKITAGLFSGFVAIVESGGKNLHFQPVDPTAKL